ncbi:MAG: PKD domain-containing protein, partial [bacterium]
DFGDGGTSQDADPTYTYTNPGVYDVTLIVTGVGGCTASSLLQDYVQVVASPTASFNYEPSSNPTLYGAIQFINNSIGAISYQWDFGDGSMGSTLENPQHRYE